MGLSLENVNKVVGKDTHLYDINLNFESGSRNVILGRTTAGKTSLLRLIAGLDKPTTGKVIVDGKDVTGVSVRKRKVAMVYQQFINYPSLTIYKNIASPLKISGMSKKDIDAKVREAAEMLHIEQFLDRLPAELSGGQQQRTAIARALVKDAELLLMDEPLVNLDYKLREELRSELQEIFKNRSAIVIYTTTEPSEALMLGGNVVIIDEGRVLQTGPTPDVFRNPATIKTARVFSDPPINTVEGTISGDGVIIDNDIKIPLTGHLKNLKNGNYRFGIRPHHLSIRKNHGDDIPVGAKVDLTEIDGSETFIHLLKGNMKFVVQETGIHTCPMGKDINFFINPKTLFVFDDRGTLVKAPPLTTT